MILSRRQWLSALLLAEVACRPRARAAPPARAFYFWRTVFRLSVVERRALADLDVTRLFVRALDVDRGERDEAPRPIARLEVAEPPPAGVDIVPVVFLRDRALRDVDVPRANALAQSMWGEASAAAARLGRAFDEVQVDCDWTDRTRAAFFSVLERLRALAQARGCAVSATIRLHQVKYRERTGVPPVSRGMLMFYNMGVIDADAASTAIFDPRRAASYLDRLAEYPLPLDVALPVWSWVVHVRGDRVVGLLQNTDEASLRGQPWLRSLGEHRFEVVDHAFLDGVLLREGDLLDAEAATPALSQAAAEMVAPHLTAPARPRTVCLFDLSEKNLALHDTASLARLFSTLA